MTTKERINEAQLDELYTVIKQFAQAQQLNEAKPHDQT
jgi:hypothetical protein